MPGADPLAAAGARPSGPEPAFIAAFTAAWHAPSAERLVALLHEDVVLRQPSQPPIHGRAAALADFRRLFAWLPALRGEVDRAHGADGLVFLEWRMLFPFGRHGLTLRAVDRFLLRDGLAIERAVYFDQVPLIAAVLTHPAHWLGFVRYRAGR